MYCSDNFERLTGYTKHMILGRNCRFLQSPDGNVASGVYRKYVDDDSVLYLKNMINLRREAQISLINYRRGGQPFMNLLTIIPVAMESDQVKYFVGFQVDLVEQPNAVTNRNSGKSCTPIARSRPQSPMCDDVRSSEPCPLPQAFRKSIAMRTRARTHLHGYARAIYLPKHTLLTRVSLRWLVLDQLPAGYDAPVCAQCTREQSAEDRSRPDSVPG